MTSKLIMPCKGTSEDEDEKACAIKLGEEPQKPEFDGLVIGEDLTKRLQTGRIDEERNMNYDNYWAEKLSCLDNAHTDRYKLTMDQAKLSMNNIEHYLKANNRKTGPLDYSTLTACLKLHKDQQLKCNEEVEKFINTVNTRMAKAVRVISDDDFRIRKKMTYAEKFQRAR